MNKFLDKAKEFGDGLLEKAKGLLCKDNVLAPVVFSVSGEEMTPVLLSIEKDEDKDAIQGILKKLTNNTDYILVIMDSYVKPVADNEEAPLNIKDHPDTISAIVSFLYLRDSTFIRNITYIKNEKEGRYNFFDQGWEEVIGGNTVKCRFANPFLSL